MAIVEYTHGQYVHAIEDWQKIRDVIEGERTIKEVGTKYPPRLSGRDTSGYAAYKTRALFFEATPRTIAGHRPDRRR